MTYNFDEKDIIDQLIFLYDNNTDCIFEELINIIYSIILNNNINDIYEIINEYGGIDYIFNLYKLKYENTSILKIDKNNKLVDYNLLAFIGLYDTIYNKIINIINDNNIDYLCNEINKL